jgi:hypothetical protein
MAARFAAVAARARTAPVCPRWLRETRQALEARAALATPDGFRVPRAAALPSEAVVPGATDQRDEAQGPRRVTLTTEPEAPRRAPASASALPQRERVTPRTEARASSLRAERLPVSEARGAPLPRA